MLLVKSAVSSTVFNRLLSCYFANSLLKSLAKTAHVHFLNSFELDTDIKSSMRSHDPAEYYSAGKVWELNLPYHLKHHSESFTWHQKESSSQLLNFIV